MFSKSYQIIQKYQHIPWIRKIERRDIPINASVKVLLLLCPRFKNFQISDPDLFLTFRIMYHQRFPDVFMGFRDKTSSITYWIDRGIVYTCRLLLTFYLHFDFPSALILSRKFFNFLFLRYANIACCVILSMYIEDYKVLSNYIVYIGRIVYIGNCSAVWLNERN